MLPSRYTAVEYLSGNNLYFNTGHNPTEKTNIRGLFYCINTGYVFGARNTDSTTSAGQLNYYYQSSGNNYVGWRSARTSFSATTTGTTFIQNKANDFDVFSDFDMRDVKPTAGTFTGTRPIYILALNNAGSPSYAGLGTGIYAFMIWENGTLVHNYAPCFDTVDNEFGLYDYVTETFSQKTGGINYETTYLLQVQGGTGGIAYIQTPNAGNVTECYFHPPGNLSLGYRTFFTAFAVPQFGYEFLNWTDQNGNIFSTSEEIECTINADTVLTANFIKKTEDKQTDKYQLLGLQYGAGVPVADSLDGKQYDIYATVRSFSIKEDSMARTTSTIEVNELPSAYQTDMPVFLFTPKGKLMYAGVIETIDDKVLTCREPLSLFDMEMIFYPSNSVNGINITTHGVRRGLTTYGFLGVMIVRGVNNYENVSGIAVDESVQRKINASYIWQNRDRRVYFDPEKNILSAFPLTEKGTKNLEDVVLEISNQFGLSVESRLYDYVSTIYPEKGIKHLLYVIADNPKRYDTLVMGNNYEQIRNVAVTEENQESTCLMVFNSAGSTLRGIYGIEYDGTITTYDSGTFSSSFISYDKAKRKIITSDDSLKTILLQNLTMSSLNHKITFDVDLAHPGYRLEDFKIGRRVDFYANNKVYKSVITGKAFTGNENGEIASVNITLGNVRTNLTTKLNIGKRK